MTIMAIDNSLSKGLERRLRRETDDKRFEKLINVTKNLQRNNRGLGNAVARITSISIANTYIK